MRIRPSSPLFLISLLLLVSHLSEASDYCVAYRNHVPIPKWYDSVCTKGGNSKNPSGTYSTISDAFRVNPASLPTHSFPYGVEWVSSYLGPPASGESLLLHNFAIIKGFERIGAGASSSSEATFFSNSSRIGLEGTTETRYVALKKSPRETLPLLNLGTSFSLGSSKNPNGLQNSIGIGVRLNTETEEGGSSLGYTLSNSFLSVGVGIGSPVDNEDFVDTYYQSLSLGLKSPWINLEYLIINNDYADPITYPSVKIQILAASRNIAGFLVTGAIRRVRNFEGNSVDAPHLSIQRAFWGRFSLGYLYNYLPGSHSLGAQVLLF